ncbi:MAG: ABC transporter ATP-binding protein [Clostridia bacterium]|nr:ABC transporter ATP-binding protein [Clostridia bacterium]
MIEINGLTKRFGTKTVFENADIYVKSGSICGLVGINGAGKSTLMRIMSGILLPDCGEVLIDGEPVYENENVKKKIFLLPDDPYYDSGVTGAKLRTLYKTFYTFDDAIFNYYISKFALDLKKPLRNFSKGMKRQTFVAAALACKPEYLLLDEAFDGLDPLARLEFKRGLTELQKEGSTILIASHALRELEDICDSFVLIDNNAVKVCGKTEKASGNVFKLQLVFNDNLRPEELPFPYVSAETSGRVITVVVRGDKEEIKEKISALNPLIMEEIPMDFEDMFIEEVTERGYLK